MEFNPAAIHAEIESSIKEWRKHCEEAVRIVHERLKDIPKVCSDYHCGEAGDFFIESDYKGRRLGFVVSVDLSKSSYFLVSKDGSMGKSGWMDEADLDSLFKEFLK